MADVKQFEKNDRLILKEYNDLIDSLIFRVRTSDSIAAMGDAFADTAADSARSTDFTAWYADIDSTGQHLLLSIKPIGDLVTRIGRRHQVNSRTLASYKVEIHKKYSIPFACILFVLIGAPLGIMARRGGLTVGASYSIFFFIIYWASLIGGENLADRTKIAPWVGMWSGNIFIAACGIVLMIFMIRETTIKFDFLVTFRETLFGRKNKRTHHAIGFIGKIPRIIAWIPRWIMRKLFGILPVYLIGSFIGYTIGVLLAIITIFITIDYVSNLRRFDGAPIINIALYYWYLLPWIVQIMVPIVLLLASMFSIGKMAKDSELIAMKAAGISLRQLTFPLLVLGMVLSVVSFYGGEWILPRANYERRLIQDNLKDPKASTIERIHGIREFRRNFYYFGNPNTIYVFGEFNTSPQRTRNVARERFSRNRIIERIQAAEMIYDSTGWRFVNGRIRRLGDMSASVITFDTLFDSILTATPISMVARIKSKEELSYWELRGFIEAAKRRGEKVQKYIGELEFKVALPFMNFIVILLGLAITARTGRKGGAVLFGIGLLLMFSYWIISRLAIVFAQNGHFPTLLGAWIGNIIFFFIGFILYLKALR